MKILYGKDVSDKVYNARIKSLRTRYGIRTGASDEWCLMYEQHIIEEQERAEKKRVIWKEIDTLRIARVEFMKPKEEFVKSAMKEYDEKIEDIEAQMRRLKLAKGFLLKSKLRHKHDKMTEWSKKNKFPGQSKLNNLWQKYSKL